jgi:hypothetical protein
MQADGHHSYQPHTKDDHRRRRGNATRLRRWLFRRALMRLPGCRQRALDRIGQTLMAEDPDLGLRFAVFTRLTQHEVIPQTEQVPRRLRQVLRRAIVLPLVLVSLLALLAASGLIPNRQACTVGAYAAAAGISPASHAALCQSGPEIKLDTMPRH